MRYRISVHLTDDEGAPLTSAIRNGVVSHDGAGVDELSDVSRAAVRDALHGLPQSLRTEFNAAIRAEYVAKHGEAYTAAVERVQAGSRSATDLLRAAGVHVHVISLDRTTTDKPAEAGPAETTGPIQ